MTFILFEQTNGSLSEHAVLRKNDYLFISNFLIDKLNIKSYKSANIYIDDENPVVALEMLNKPATQRTAHRKIVVEKIGIVINIARVLKYYRIGQRYRTYSLDIKKDKSSGFLMIDLTDIRNEYITKDKNND